MVQALANTLINNSPEVKLVVDERNALVRQNKELMTQLSGLQGTAPSSASSSATKQSVTQTVPKSAAQSAAAGTPDIYHVVSGDTLTKIASKFYGDSGKWDVILDANKDRLASPRDLKVGQTLVIPRIAN